MRAKLGVASLTLGLIMSSTGHSASTKKPDDFTWLEELRSDKALGWVKTENERSLKTLEALPTYAPMQKDALAILEAKDKIPFGGIRGDHVYNFWQDAQHVKGIWRRATWASYTSGKPEWDTLLDVDKLAKDEGKNYVYAGVDCLRPEHRYCLVSLSDGGSDAAFVREFDIEKKAFVAGGFELPASKSGASWISKDEVFFENALTEATHTDSGYPIQVQRWKRGTPAASSPVVFKGEKTDVSVRSFILRDQGKEEIFFSRGLSFYTSEYHYQSGSKLVKLPLPIDVDVRGLFKGQLLILNRKPLAGFAPGSLIAADLAALAKGEANFKLVFAPTDKQSIEAVDRTKDYVFLNLLDNVRSRVARLEFDGKAWVQKDIPLPTTGSVNLISLDEDSNRLLLSFEDFLTPSSLYAVDGQKLEPKVVMQAPKRFNADGLVINQEFATSSDGEKIPYFIIHKKDLKKDGTNPTLLYGYGGFEVSLTPSYAQIVGKLWLERGGVYVLSNIRGGGEYGPRWHQAALLENRQKAYDDFTAIAQDLIKKGVTSPSHLGIMGGSNGGLLMGVSFTQHPELFNAVVCQVPLLDMLRYHKLLAGASWMAEYGNPDVPKDRAVLEKYSPFQNLKADKKYPEVFFVTSTADDRVHPSHARRVAARMQANKQPFYYYENIDGGHSASADLQARAKRSALEYSYLWMKLAPKPKS